ncbi:hypothetical protein CAter282_3861 [Collimonas arenae]|uniref:Uncharacterized protein n=1 Tax=Collimonas arenae TaxID=279058 RepID=A0A127QNB6_9BURK|nr:hypothetical protein CAter282_3861 [Collimonas arenae]
MLYSDNKNLFCYLIPRHSQVRQAVHGFSALATAYAGMTLY